MSITTSILIAVCITFAVYTRRHNCAQAELTQIVNISKSFPGWAGRLYSVSTDSPFARVIRRDVEGDRKLGRAFKLLDDLSAEAVRRRTEHDVGACNVPLSVRWTARARNRMSIFQIGFINQECFTRVDISKAIADKQIPSGYSGNVRDIVRDAQDVIENATRRLQFYRDGNWSDPDAPYGFNTRPYTYERQICLADTLFAYRVNGSWYVRASATNHPRFQNMPDLQRHFLNEFVPRNGTASLQMVHTSRKTGKLELATTLTSAWSGHGLSIETLEFDQLDMPLFMAYKENLVEVDIAADAVTPSNVAILALPMVMSLIPVAFVADLNTLGMFAYILVTDVFSTTPFLIKGAELVRSSTQRKTTMMYYHGGNETLGNSQVYIIDCRAEGVFRNTGIVFIAIALSSMVLGLLLELCARRVMRKRRSSALNGSSVNGPFGRAVYDETTHGLLGRNETRAEQEFWEKQERLEI